MSNSSSINVDEILEKFKSIFEDEDDPKLKTMREGIKSALEKEQENVKLKSRNKLTGLFDAYIKKLERKERLLKPYSPSK